MLSNWKKIIGKYTFSFAVIAGSMMLSYLVFRYIRHQQANVAGDIQAIIQTTGQTGLKSTSLPTVFLAETLGLSNDFPTKLSQFDIGMAKKHLLATHIIKDVRLKKIKPNLLFIHYSTRTPMAYLEDYTNTAIDAEGVLFPYSPFCSPRHLPCIYLGKKDTPSPWGEKIAQEHLMLIERLFANLGEEKIRRIDISQLDANVGGRREFVIVLNDGSILRLLPTTYSEQLNNYAILKKTILKKHGPTIIDLRISEVAYISTLEQIAKL